MPWAGVVFCAQAGGHNCPMIDPHTARRAQKRSERERRNRREREHACEREQSRAALFTLHAHIDATPPPRKPTQSTHRKQQDAGALTYSMETPWKHVRTQSKGLCLAAKRAIAPGALVRVYVCC